MSKLFLSGIFAAAALGLTACSEKAEENNMAVENLEEVTTTEDANMAMDNMDMNMDMNATDNAMTGNDAADNATGNAY
jgi:hypothetical protein